MSAVDPTAHHSPQRSDPERPNPERPDPERPYPERSDPEQPYPERLDPERSEAAPLDPRRPEVLARGPWPLERVSARWAENLYEPPAEYAEQADLAISELQRRGSPSHDGMAGRLVGFREHEGVLELKMQPVRWALRLVDGDASRSMAAMCVTRDADGRWLAGRRAPWVASWAGRWALGAGGAVDLGESPAETLVRELREEWAVTPERVRAEALVELPHRMVMFVGQAWLAEGVEVTPDHEHDQYAWWPAEIGQWPPEAGEVLPRMARWLTQP